MFPGCTQDEEQRTNKATKTSHIFTSFLYFFLLDLLPSLISSFLPFLLFSYLPSIQFSFYSSPPFSFSFPLPHSLLSLITSISLTFSPHLPFLPSPFPTLSSYLHFSHHFTSSSLPFLFFFSIHSSLLLPPFLSPFHLTSPHLPSSFPPSHSHSQDVSRKYLIRIQKQV